MVHVRMPGLEEAYLKIDGRVSACRHHARRPKSYGCSRTTVIPLTTS